jgi:hypothetical protein
MSFAYIKLYEFARKEMNLSEDKAIQFIQAIGEVINENIKSKRLTELTTKSTIDDKMLLHR